MPKLELYDTVVLTDNRKLYGTVERVHQDDDDALDDCLIIAHVPVDPKALASFIQTGTPPRGYVFIQLADVTLGHVLVREDQVELIDRTFAFGDYVKQEGSSALGAIIDFAETFVLQPLWKSIPTLGTSDRWPVVASSDTSRKPPHICDDACPNPNLRNVPNAFPSDLICNVPGRELKKASDASEGSLFIKGEFVGIVDDLTLHVTLVMEDGSIVVVLEAEELYVPIPDFGDKPLVSLPEFDPDVPRPDIVVAQHGWSATIPLPYDGCHSGQLVVTNGRNLRLGRWLHGKYNSEIPHQGRIIDVRTRELHPRWLTSGPYHPDDDSCSGCTPANALEMYENIRTFSSRSELRRDKTIMPIEPSKIPQAMEDRRRTRSTTGSASNRSHIITPSDIQIGNHVKFRDQAGAAVKYHGLYTTDGVVHGAFERTSPTLVSGFDVNILKVVSTQQEVTVRWQDGSTTKHKSVSLRKYDLFETDFMPSDMVVARESMMQRPVGVTAGGQSHAWSPFNEMTIVERPHDLRPHKVGILQSVDPIERVAHVKWYTGSSILLTGADHSILDRTSRLGQIIDQVEDVSLYEIMTFTALTQHLKDLVIIPPSSLHEVVVKHFQVLKRESYDAGMTTASTVAPRSRREWVRYSAAGILDLDSFNTVPDSPQWLPNCPPPDWCGEIIRLEVDGSVIVRINAGEYSKDVLLDRDQIIFHIDEALLGWGGYSYSQDSIHGQDAMSDGSWNSSISDRASTISESIEYEGGHRLDDDTDDDNWDDEVDDEVDNDIEMTDAEPDNVTPFENSHSQDMLTQESPFKTAPSPEADIRKSVSVLQQPQVTTTDDDAISYLCGRLSEEPPPSFAVLDTLPPSDQFQESSNPLSNSSAFMKRILKEHKILSTSLPYGEIYVRTYESRLDLMRCLIIGPQDSPFEYAPFVFDLQFKSNFPKRPPVAHFHSWTHGLGRINPNLYEEGKICLSLLGTWQGKGESETWTEQATVLQILVSLQGLVFVPRPFYNEAGYEEAGAEDAYVVESLRYNEKTFVMARAFVKHALRNTVAGLEDVLAWIYLPRDGDVPGLLSTVIDRARRLIRAGDLHSPLPPQEDLTTDMHQISRDSLVDGEGGSQGDTTKTFLRPLSRGAIVMLKKTLLDLDDLLHAVNVKMVDQASNPKQ